MGDSLDPVFNHGTEHFVGCFEVLQKGCLHSRDVLVLVILLAIAELRGFGAPLSVLLGGGLLLLLPLLLLIVLRPIFIFVLLLLLPLALKMGEEVM